MEFFEKMEDRLEIKRRSWEARMPQNRNLIVICVLLLRPIMTAKNHRPPISVTVSNLTLNNYP